MPDPVLHEVYALDLLLVTQGIAVQCALVVYAEFALDVSSVGGLAVHFSHGDGTLFEGDDLGRNDILDVFASEDCSGDAVAFPALEGHSLSVLFALELHALRLVLILQSIPMICMVIIADKFESLLGPPL